jgi:hypothetical protein
MSSRGNRWGNGQRPLGGFRCQLLLLIAARRPHQRGGLPAMTMIYLEVDRLTIGR